MKHGNCNFYMHDLFSLMSQLIMPRYISLHKIKIKTIERIGKNRHNFKKVLLELMQLEDDFRKFVARSILKRNTFFLGTPRGMLFSILQALLLHVPDHAIIHFSNAYGLVSGGQNHFTNVDSLIFSFVLYILQFYLTYYRLFFSTVEVRKYSRSTGNE